MRSTFVSTQFFLTSVDGYELMYDPWVSQNEEVHTLGCLSTGVVFLSTTVSRIIVLRSLMLLVG